MPKCLLIRNVLHSIWIGALLCVMAQAQTAAAAINEQIAFYGTLQDSGGNDLSGTYDMVFRFYDAPTGGTLLDTSTHTAANGNPVTVSDGEFVANLGSGAGNALDGLDFNAGAIYVGLSINTDSEMTPRERLTAAAYAFNSDTLDGYDASQLLRYNATGSISANAADTLFTITQNGTGDVLNVFDGATEVFTILDGGSVGVATSAPSRTLSIAGDIYATGALYDSTNSAGTNGYVLQTTGSGFAWVATSSLGIGGGGGSSLFTDGGTTTYLTSTTDNLAIGTTSANAKLTVAGNINIDNPAAGVSLMGKRFLYGSTTNRSVSVGENAGEFFNSNASFNVALGWEAGRYASSSTARGNIYVGAQAGVRNTGINNSIVGISAGQDNTGEANNLIGVQAGENNTGDRSNIIGELAGGNNTGDYNNMMGYWAGRENTGNFNEMMGYWAGRDNTGSGNLIFGLSAGSSNTGFENNLLGNSAGYENSGYGNNLIGVSAGHSNAGDYNNIFGDYTGYDNTGNYNNFFGANAGYENTGNDNQLIGRSAGEYFNGTNTVAIGALALAGTASFTAINNTALGSGTGRNIQTGANNNILLGYQAADSLTTGANNIIIGYDVEAPSNTANGQLNIGNLIFGTGIDGTGTTVSSGNIGIGTSTPQSELAVIGDIRVGTSGTNGCIEGFDGSALAGVCSSDERLKTDIVELSSLSDSYLENLVALSPVTYGWNHLAQNELQKTTGTNVTGLTAQNVEESFPELVSVGEGGFKQVRFSDLPFYIIQAMKEMWAVVTRVDGEVQDMRETIETLDTRVQKDQVIINKLIQRIESLESKHDVTTDSTTESEQEPEQKSEPEKKSEQESEPEPQEPTESDNQGDEPDKEQGPDSESESEKEAEPEPKQESEPEPQEPTESDNQGEEAGASETEDAADEELPEADPAQESAAEVPELDSEDDEINTEVPTDT